MYVNFAAGIGDRAPVAKLFKIDKPVSIFLILLQLGTVLGIYHCQSGNMDVDWKVHFAVVLAFLLLDPLHE